MSRCDSFKNESARANMSRCDSFKNESAIGQKNAWR